MTNRSGHQPPFRLVGRSTVGESPVLEALPAHFEPGLRQLDDRLCVEFWAPGWPAGLEERIYLASVDALPSDRKLILPRVEIVRRLGWRHLAHAAALGLAFVVAAIFMRAPDASAPAVELTLAEYGWLAEVPSVPEDRRVAYLLDTVLQPPSAISLNDLSGEMQSLVNELGM